MPTLVLAIVTHADEITLACASSLLRLQQVAAQQQDTILDVHLVSTFLDALNVYRRGDYLLVLDGSIGMPPQFAFDAVRSGHEVVAGVYPVPRVDWDRVQQAVDNETHEPIQHAGNVYNVTLAQGPVMRYAKVDRVDELRVLFLKSSVLRELESAVPSCANGTVHLFAYESVHDDTFHNAYQTLARSIGTHRIVADLDAQCSCSGPAHFAGCVGVRGAVR